ncbi:hypothetical protein F66182_10421 [Fusarium sp. NRRL 66182]|nr:hypothetical protein F66182_10421 [Fusarium sp. NRRL 66182]
MAPVTYSARELLRLRHTAPPKEVSYQLAAKVEADFDLEIGDIIRTGSARPLSLIVEESGGSSDSDDHIHRSAAQQLDGTDSERKYRARSDSEHERGPIIAPPDLATQKSEGFQKFYNSVVSPTHVRVTAGGRIVPNTRGPHSPTSKWTRERSSVDAQTQARPFNGSQPDSVPYPVLPPGWGHFATVVPPHAPGTLPGMTLRPEGYPFMAPHMSFNLAAVPYNQFPPPNLSIQHPSQATHFVKHPDVSAEQARNIHLSPAEQFDPSRPFYYNGQWLIANGNNLYPINMMPQMGFAPPPMANQPLPRHSGDFNPPSARMSRVPSRQPDPSPVSLKAAMGDASRSTSPPVSSIRPSSITQKQLEVLRSQKRYHQDQLQYNKHQIDLKDMEDRLQTICREIEHFERMYATQLEFEARKYPKLESQADDVHSSASTGYAHSDSDSDGPITVPAVPSSGFKNHSSGRKTHVRSVSAHSLPKPAAIVASAKSPNYVSNNDNVSQRKSSSLPINAALAPVFQPRADMTTSTVATDEEEAARARHHERMSKSAEHWRSYFKKTEGVKNYGIPYLMGKLNPGVRPENARDADYTYDRPLTEEEERARYMYWGKAPHHVQNGLPKYDGKHFYPPSPVKEEPMNGAVSATQSLSQNNETKPPSVKAGDTDPFHAVAQEGMSTTRNRLDEATRSESLHRTDGSLRASSISELPRSESYASHPSPRYMEFRQIVNERARISTEKYRAKVSDDSGDEDGNLLFKGRRTIDRPSNKYPSDIWSTMRKNGKTSANVIAGQVSPMTAQGVLPHYSGHATASLTPTFNTNSRGHGVRLGETNDSTTTNTPSGRHEENRPPLELLERQLRSVSLQDRNPQGFSS